MTARRKWGASLNTTAKVDNAKPALAAKIDIRRRIMAALCEPPRVFDAFAGAGHMHRAVWSDAPVYVGCDLKWSRDSRIAYVADNRRVMRAIDLQAFNLFDLDAYGSPWEQALILAARRGLLRPGERLGVALTDGQSMRIRLGALPRAMRVMTGFPTLPAGASSTSGFDLLIDAAVAGLGRRLGGEVEHQWRAMGKNAALMRYIGVVYRGREVPPEPPVE
jgi:hypothetical protein